MASTHASLDASATERKARLAKLKSLKRKQPDTPADDSSESTSASAHLAPDADQSSSPPPKTTKYLSGRNYDPEVRGPKLGFESAPTENAETLEDRAEQIARETREQEEKEEKEERPIDLFKLQPKKPNWDLKRDLARKMETLNVRTENAIARLVRERIEGSKKKSVQHTGPDGGEQLGMEGEELVEGVHMREREEEKDERREREYAEALE
ncbi:MAG: hypothetical protein LQ343_008088 [Gyalolechia ehrenbergii]|nr:MAG: hypothetical protein LQ343_008088 [Gyalolechia ehrenbergii]